MPLMTNSLIDVKSDTTPSISILPPSSTLKGRLPTTWTRLASTTPPLGSDVERTLTKAPSTSALTEGETCAEP